MKRNGAMIILAILLLTACNMPAKSSPSTPSISLDTMVAQTLTAMSQNQALTPSLTTAPLHPTNTPPPAFTQTLTMTLAPSLTFTPSRTTAPTATQAATNTPIPKPGTIQGSISGYPYGALPSLSIVAFMQDPPYNYSYWITAPGDTFYSMTSNYLLPGKYQVVAYDSSGHSGGCPAIAIVKSDESVTCAITDWSGNYPPKPAGVPAP